MRNKSFCGALAALALSTPAVAAEDEETPICTDRPTKANATCTVPTGNWQLESSAVSWSRTEADGAESNLLAIGSAVMKVGLSDRSELQIGFAPYIRSEVEIGDAKSHATGFGDMTVRYKHRLTGDHSAVQVGLIPLVKLPTADGNIGNGKVEGGLAVPISVATGSQFTVVLGPELDLLADSGGSGHHAALVNLINLSGPIADGVTIYGELWTMTNFDPADNVTLASADVAITYLASPRLQLDAGANFGLTKDTADTELYVGVSLRF